MANQLTNSTETDNRGKNKLIKSKIELKSFFSSFTWYYIKCISRRPEELLEHLKGVIE